MKKILLLLPIIFTSVSAHAIFVTDQDDVVCFSIESGAGVGLSCLSKAQLEIDKLKLAQLKKQLKNENRAAAKKKSGYSK